MAIEFEEVLGQIETETKKAEAGQQTDRNKAGRLVRAVRETMARENWRAARLSSD